MRMPIGSKVVGVAGDAKSPILLTEDGSVYIKRNGMTPEKFVFVEVNLEYLTEISPSTGAEHTDD